MKKSNSRQQYFCDKHSIWLFALLGFSTLTSTAQVQDIDGNIYQIVELGCQTWMAENLRTTRYANGNMIDHLPGNSEWLNATQGAWSIYDNDVSNDSLYGKLYNWYAVSDNRNVCPTGWHVPSESEWETLKTFLRTIPGSDLKSTGTIPGGDGLWNGPNNFATNETGFTAHPAGYRPGSFYSKGTYTRLYTQDLSSDRGINYIMYGSRTNLSKNTLPKNYGASVRCIKDEINPVCDTTVIPVIDTVQFFGKEGKNVVGGPKILDIKFNKPMETESVGDAFSLGVAENDVCYQTRSGFFNWITQQHVQLQAHGEEAWLDCVLKADTTYTLSIESTAQSADGNALSSDFEINFETQPMLEPGFLGDTLKSYYLNQFSIDIEQPVWYTNDFGNKSYHTSTVYQGDSLVRVFMLADGTSFHRNYKPTVFPRDTLKVAVVTVDYGNSNIGDIYGTQWIPAQDTVNILQQEFATIRGYNEPVVQFENVNFLVTYESLSHPWPRDNNWTSYYAEKDSSVISILSDNGYTEEDFDLYALFDMDTEYTKGGVYFGKMVYVGWYYSSTNFYEFTPEDTKPHFFVKTMYDHEIGHAMGWGHVWSQRYLLDGTGTTSNSTYDFQTFPQLYGWTDTNCNGIPEIKEGMPYRLSISVVDNDLLANNPGQAVFRSSTSIISDASLQENLDYEFHALDYVKLTPEFEVLMPATLFVQMDGCDDSN